MFSYKSKAVALKETSPMDVLGNNFVSGFIGFADLAGPLEVVIGTKFDTSAFPFYNILSKEHGYRLDISVPHFKEDELAINLNKGELTVTGTREPVKNEDVVFIGDKTPEKFSRSFRVFAGLVIESVTLSCGVLSITFESVLPQGLDGTYPVNFKGGQTVLVEKKEDEVPVPEAAIEPPAPEVLSE